VLDAGDNRRLDISTGLIGSTLSFQGEKILVIVRGLKRKERKNEIYP
jgi:hypothetical protein